jgi:hypothetical protein
MQIYRSALTDVQSKGEQATTRKKQATTRKIEEQISDLEAYQQHQPEEGNAPSSFKDLVKLPRPTSTAAATTPDQAARSKGTNQGQRSMDLAAFMDAAVKAVLDGFSDRNLSLRSGVLACCHAELSAPDSPGK